MWTRTPITQKLGIRYPIIQGPFGGGFSTAQLVAAVSNGGGLGSFGAQHLEAQQIREVIAEIRALTDRPFAINLWVSDHDPGGLGLSQAEFEHHLEYFQPYYDELGIAAPAYPQKFGERFADQVAAILDARPPVFSFVFGVPAPDILEACRARGIATIGAATTVDEAIAIEAAGVDMTLATGFEAGGHRPSFLRSAEDSLMGTLALVPQVVDRVKIPVIAAGGIGDGRGIAAALTLGAHGVQLGTAFLACEESGAVAAHRERIFSEAARHTTLTRAYSGRLARFIPNRFIAERNANPEKILPFPIQSWFVGPLKKAALSQGRDDLSGHYAGQAAPLLRHRNATQLLESLVGEVNQLSANFHAGNR